MNVYIHPNAEIILPSHSYIQCETNQGIKNMDNDDAANNSDSFEGLWLWCIIETWN